MSRIPIRITPTSTLTTKSKMAPSTSNHSREAAFAETKSPLKPYNFITTPFPSNSDNDDIDPAPVEVQPFQDFNVLDASTNQPLQQILHAIPEVPFAYANLLEFSAFDVCSEANVRDRFRTMVRGTYDYHLRIRESTRLGALPRRMEMLFDHDNLHQVRFISPPGVSAVPSDDGQYHLFKGNPQYVAPEVAQGRVHAAHQVDIWVLGIALYVMLVGRYPFSATNDRKLFKKMIRGSYTVPDYISIEAQDLIHRMLSPNPITRASFDLVLIHPWLEPLSTVPQSVQNPVTPVIHPKKSTSPFSSVRSLKSLFRRHGSDIDYTQFQLTTPPRTPSPQLTSSPSHSTTSLPSTADQSQFPGTSTSTIHTSSTRPTTISASSFTSTASSISSSVKSAFKWILDGPNPPPPRQRKGVKRHSPYGPKPDRNLNVAVDMEGCFASMGGETERDGNWRYKLIKEIVKTSVIREEDRAHLGVVE